MMDKKSNVLIVEDHALTSFALKTSLSNLDFINKIFEAESSKCAFEIIKKNKIDLIIMDLGLPDLNGIETSKEIKKFNEKAKIIILTSHQEKDEVQQCLEAGINAYCTKDIKPDKLINVIKDVLDGSLYFDSTVAQFVLNYNSKNNSNLESKDDLNDNKENQEKNHTLTIKDCYNLTQQEKRVLILLASGNNNSQIAKKLKISINTTKVHVCSILQKMNVEDRTQAAIKTIRENLIN